MFELASELGGRVRYDYEPRDPGWSSIWMSYPLFYSKDSSPRPWGPNWAHRLLGDEYFHRIVAVELSSWRLEPRFQVEDETEVEVISFEEFTKEADISGIIPSLRILDSNEQTQLKKLCRLGELKHIKFENVLVDVAILEILSDCQSLESVSISPVAFDNDELQLLAQCRMLKFIEFFEGDYHTANQVTYQLTTVGIERLIESLPDCTIHLTENDSAFRAQFPREFRQDSSYDK